MSAPPNIVLIGFMGTGKSAVGQCLAQHLRLRFIDADAEIEARAGKPIRQLFTDDGEAAFRAVETALLEQWAADACSERAVIATGGGMPLRPGNAVLLQQTGLVVWLTAAPEDILARVGPDLSLRPLLAAHQHAPLARIKDLLAARQPSYAAAAQACWDTSSHSSPEAAAAALAEYLCQLI